MFRRNSKAQGALQGSEQRTRDWQLASAVLLGLLLMTIVVSCNRQNDITVSIPPDLSAGAKFKAGYIPKSNVYLFTSEVWRTVNLWQKDGDKDMLDNLKQYAMYFSSSVIEEQKAIHAVRVQKGQSAGRTRRMNEIVELKDVEQAVRVLGADTWEVNLDLRLTEDLNGTTVKDQPLRFVVRVVQDNSDPNNPFKMKITSISQPRVIEFEDSDKRRGE